MATSDLNNAESKPERKKLIKCVVWDLDNTLWDGVFLEDTSVALRAEALYVIKALDERGILQSIASKNDYAGVIEKLQVLGIDEYFLYPQITWNSKVSSLKIIAQKLNIGLDAIALIDDQPFEREEVNFSLPEVLCIDAAHPGSLLNRPEMQPSFLTEDAKMRRAMYISDKKRKEVEEAFIGPREVFLASLAMRLTISQAREEDLMRAEELTVRTNQLNTTGYTYSYRELNEFRQSKKHLLLMASLDDKYGTYGKIGLALVECGEDTWTIKLLLMSCRVMTRGIGMILIHFISSQARARGFRLRAEFVANQRNRMMYITYKFMGFQEVEKSGDLTILENDGTRIQAPPAYVSVQIPDLDQPTQIGGACF